MCYQVRFITRSVKCLVTMRWVMAWLGNGFGYLMKDESTCTMRRESMRHEVGVHLWRMMIWCGRSTKECVTTHFTISGSVPARSSDFKNSTLWHCQQSFGLLESVCTMGAKDARRGAQKTACCMCFDIYYALSEGRRRRVKSHCDRRQNMGVPYRTWIKTAVLALEAYWLAKKQKVQADVFNKEDRVYRILGQTMCSLGRNFAPRYNNKLCCLLWNAEEAEACNSKQKVQNAECHNSLASR